MRIKCKVWSTQSESEQCNNLLRGSKVYKSVGLSILMNREDFIYNFTECTCGRKFNRFIIVIFLYTESLSPILEGVS